MTKQYVPLHKNLSRSVTVETDATIGATVGTNLFWPDGTVVTEAELRSLTGTTTDFTLNIAYKIFVPVSRTLTGVDSITGGGDLSANRTFSLVNDEASPAADYFYGTDACGNRGYQPLPNSFGLIEIASGDSVEAQIPSDAVTFVAGDNMSIIGDQSTNTITFSAVGGSESPLTTKGDIYAYSTVNARLPVGTSDGERLAVNSASTFGLRYERAAYDPRYELFWSNQMLGKPPTSITAEAGASYDLALRALTAGITIASVASSGSFQGCWQIATGTVSSGSCVMGLGIVDNFFTGAGKIIIGTRVKIPTLSDATENFTVAFGLNATGNANRVMFTYNHGTNSGAWTCTTIVASVPDTASSGITVVANTVYALEFVIDAAASSVEFFINGASVDTNANVPTAGMKLEWHMVKSAGSTSRTFDINKGYIYQRYTTAQG